MDEADNWKKKVYSSWAMAKHPCSPAAGNETQTGP